MPKLGLFASASHFLRCYSDQRKNCADLAYSKLKSLRACQKTLPPSCHEAKFAKFFAQRRLKSKKTGVLAGLASWRFVFSKLCGSAFKLFFSLCSLWQKRLLQEV
jgi:hypothetical protein